MGIASSKNVYGWLFGVLAAILIGVITALNYKVSLIFMVLVILLTLISVILLKLRLNFIKISLAGIMIFLPFQNQLIFNLGLFTLKMSQVFFFIGLIIIILNKNIFKKQSAIILLVIPPLLSLTKSIVPNRTIVLTSALVLLFLMYLVVYHLSPKIDRMFLIKSIILGGVIASAYGIYQYVGYKYFGIDTGILYNVWDVAPKITSFSVPNQLGNYLLLPISLSIYAMEVSTKASKKFTYFISFIMCSIALALTVSTGAIIALVIGFVIYMFLKNRKSRTFLFIFIILTTVVISILYMAGSLHSNSSFNSFADTRTGERELLWGVAWTLFKTSPIFGIGIDNFPVYVPNYLSYLHVSDHKEIHNTFLTILTEMGIVGVLFYVGSLIMVFLRGFSVLKICTKEDRILISCLMFGTLAMTLHYLTDNGLYMMHYWVSIALLSCFINKAKSDYKLRKTT